MIGRRHQTAGDAFGRAISLWAHHLPVVAAITVPLAVVGFFFVLVFAYLALDFGGTFDIGDSLFLAVFVLWFVLSASPLAVVADDALEGRPVTLVRTAKRIGTRLPSMVLTSVLTALPWCLLSLAFAPALAVGDELRIDEPLVVMLVLVCGAPVVLWLFLSLVVAAPAALVERLGPWAAVRRSWALTKGERMTLLGLFIVAGLVLAGIIFIIVLLVDTIDVTESLSNLIGALLLLSATTGVVGVLVGTIHHDLRVRRDGTSTDGLREIFR